MKRVRKVVGTILVLVAIFAFDYLVDLPHILHIPELWECATSEEIATGAENAGFQWCGPT